MTTEALSEVPQPAESTSLAIQRTGFLQPANLREALEIADTLAKSDLVPAEYRGKPANVVVAMELGASVGLRPLQALQSIAVIGGKPTIYGDAGLAIVQSQPDFDDIHETWEGVPYDDDFRAICTIKRKSRSPVTRSFSVAEAKEAKLWGRKTKNGAPTPWITHPKRMLQWRARWFAMRDLFADVLKGLGGYEEHEGNVIEGVAEEVTPSPAPAKAPEAGTHSVFDDRTKRSENPVVADKLAEYLGRIDTASTRDEIKAIGEEAKTVLGPADLERAREAAGARLEQLKDGFGFKGDK